MRQTHEAGRLSAEDHPYYCTIQPGSWRRGADCQFCTTTTICGPPCTKVVSQYPSMLCKCKIGVVLCEVHGDLNSMVSCLVVPFIELCINGFCAYTCCRFG